jgi:hypothetical protein
MVQVVISLLIENRYHQVRSKREVDGRELYGTFILDFGHLIDRVAITASLFNDVLARWLTFCHA